MPRWPTVPIASSALPTVASWKIRVPRPSAIPPRPNRGGSPPCRGGAGGGRHVGCALPVGAVRNGFQALRERDAHLADHVGSNYRRGGRDRRDGNQCRRLGRHPGDRNQHGGEHPVGLPLCAAAGKCPLERKRADAYSRRWRSDPTRMPLGDLHRTDRQCLGTGGSLRQPQLEAHVAHGNHAGVLKGP